MNGLRRRFLALIVAFGSGTILAGQGPEPVYVPGPGVTPPRLVHRVEPSYTAEAKAAQLQGWVTLQALVSLDGSVRGVTVLESCLGRVGAHREPNGDPFRCATAEDLKDPKRTDTSLGLDQEAVNALEQWIFEPAMKDGLPVAFRMNIRVPFRPDGPRE
jgi:hypothetical protein